ncbi:protein JINGUBANG [Jatropha curcas]|uniref:protein JINGUBANG n=1 Tax=Jatropha curcas TaxID=180498 RepID=UPI0005FB3BF5|nr:protein JINGUBANG [Jatropha curcas]
MASMGSPNSPPNPSFTIRETNHEFLKSLSSKEPSFADFLFSPPNLATPHRLSVPYCSPPRPQTPTNSLISNSKTTYTCLSSVLKKDGQILSMAMSNGLVYTGSHTNSIRIWKLPEFAECGQLKTKTCMVVALEVSHDRVYAAYGDGKIRIWRRTWDAGFKHVRLATIPKTGGYVWSYMAGKDKTMKHMGPITSLAINISDDTLYSASLDKTVKVWRLSDLKCIETIQAHSEPINAIVVADDGVLYTASDDASIKVWRRNFYITDLPHSLITTVPAKSSPVKALTLTTDHNRILYGGCTDGYIHYWLRGRFSGQLQYGGALQGHTHAVMSIESVGSYVISGSADSSSRVWLRESDGQHGCLAVLVGHRGPVRCVSAYLGWLAEDNSEEDCTICTGSLDGVIKFWRVTRTNKDIGGLSPNGYEYFELQ